MRLPTLIHAPSRSAKVWLVGSALLLWPADYLLVAYGATHQEVIHVSEVVLVDGVDEKVDYDVERDPPWVVWVRMVLPVVVLSGLIATRRVGRLDVGFSAGKLSVTIWWVAIAAGLWSLCQFGWLAYVAIMRGCWTSTEVSVLYDLDDLWEVFFDVCIATVIIEEPLYRAIPTTVLDRRRPLVTVLGGGLVWTSIHFLGGHSLLSGIYFIITGCMGAWLFLMSRSLLPSAFFHVLANGGVILTDIWILQDPESYRQLLGIPG